MEEEEEEKRLNACNKKIMIVSYGIALAILDLLYLNIIDITRDIESCWI